MVGKTPCFLLLPSELGVVAIVQVAPLSVLYIAFLLLFLSPLMATKRPLPYAIPFQAAVVYPVGPVREIHVTPLSELVMMLPVLETATNVPSP